MTKPATEIRIGVSSCLLGEKVRYDGGHRLDRWVVDTLAAQVTIVPVCPEVEVGMSVPRETVRLEGDPAGPSMIASESGKDWTAPMNRWAEQRVHALEGEDLCGFVFKKNSPSCGLLGTKVFDAEGNPSPSGRGLFAAAFTRRFPLVPVVDEGRLQEPGGREEFMERVFALRRAKDATVDRG